MIVEVIFMVSLLPGYLLRVNTRPTQVNWLKYVRASRVALCEIFQRSWNYVDRCVSSVGRQTWKA